MKDITIILLKSTMVFAMFAAFLISVTPPILVAARWYFHLWGL